MEKLPSIKDCANKIKQLSIWSNIDPHPNLYTLKHEWLEDFVEYCQTPQTTPIQKSLRSLKPCDCKDIATAMLLGEQGIGVNDDSISIEPNSVILTMNHTTIKIPMSRFKTFAQWYLTEQEIPQK